MRVKFVMGHSQNTKNIISLLYFIAVGCIITLQYWLSYDRFFVVVGSFFGIPLWVSYILKCVKKKEFTKVVFYGLNFELILFMLLWVYAFKIQESSWRLHFFGDKNSDIAIFAMNVSFYIMIIADIFFDIALNKIRIKKVSRIKESILSDLEINVWLTVFLGYLIMVFWNIGFGTIRIYSTEKGNITYLTGRYAIILVIFLSVILGILRYRPDIVKNIYYDIILLLYLLELISVSFHGYRYLLVIICVEMIEIVFSRIEVNSKQIFLLLLVVFGVYVLLTLMKIVYIQNAFGNVWYGIDAVGKHERNNFYSLIAIINNTKKLNIEENTYINGLLIVVPRTISGRDIQTGANVLIKYYDQGWVGTGINMGAYYITEAFFNYKTVGVFCVSIIIPFVFCIVEKMKKGKNFLGKYFYMYFLGQVYSIIYYGFANYFRYMLYYFLLILGIDIIHRIFFVHLASINKKSIYIDY